MMLKRNVSLLQRFLWREKYANREDGAGERAGEHQVRRGLLEMGRCNFCL